MKPLSPASILIITIATVFTFGCTAQEEAADEGSTTDAITSADGLASGDQAVTTARLNLRVDASTDDDVLLTMPSGALVTLVSGTPVRGFYNVDYEGQRGWAFGRYLRKSASKGSGPGSSSDDKSGGGAAGAGGDACYDSTMGAQLARASRVVNGDHSQGLCYRYVKDHIEEAGIPIRSLIPASYQASAYMFAVWAKSDPKGLAAAGLGASSASLDALPDGAILVWRAGQCGYSAEHGHIEINIGGGLACSDFCGHIRRDCGMPDIFEPIQKTCR